MVPAPTADMYKLFVTAVLIHWLYPFFLIAPYRFGDLSAVFPLARFFLEQCFDDAGVEQVPHRLK